MLCIPALISPCRRVDTAHVHASSAPYCAQALYFLLKRSDWLPHTLTQLFLQTGVKRSLMSDNDLCKFGSDELGYDSGS